MPEYKQGEIAAELERRIAQGALSGKLPPVNELAAEFNVNIRTMAKTLSLLGKKGLIAKKRGIGAFVAEASASAPKVFINYYSSIRIQESLYHIPIYEGLKTAFNAAGCKFEIGRDFSGGAYEGYDAVVFIGHQDGDEYLELRKAKKPFVVMERLPQPELCSIYPEIRKPLYATLSKMLAAGFKRIAYIGMTTSRQLYTDIEKFHVWLEATDDALHGIDFGLVRHVWPAPENGYTAAADLLDKASPDAIFVTTDQMAAGVYRAAEERGLRIPEDLSVLGCDGLGMDLSPSLATIATPRFELGRRGAEMLVEMLREPGRRRSLKESLPCEFVKGESLRIRAGKA